MQRNMILTIVKGVIIGSTMLVPGVSGGSMAMILGVYDKLVSSVSSFMRHKLENSLFLALFSLGGCLGIFLFAKPLLHMIERYPMPMLYFFIGAVAGGIPLIAKQARITAFSWKIPIYVGLGLIAVMLLTLLPIGVFQSEMEAGMMSFLLLMLAGLIAAAALVLPGISVSFMLLFMGLYDETVRAVTEFYLPFLMPLGIGLLLGIALTTRFLERAMKKYPQFTYLIILGFVIGSLMEVFPGIPSGTELMLCGVTLLIGFISMRLLEWKENKKSKAHSV